MGEAIIRLMTDTDCNSSLNPDVSVSMRQLPNPEYTVDTFLIILLNILPLFVVLGYIYSVGVFTKVHVYIYTHSMYVIHVMYGL